MEERSLVLWRAHWCGGERSEVKDSALVWRRAPRCEEKRPGVEESNLV